MVTQDVYIRPWEKGGGNRWVKGERKGIEELCTHGHLQIPTSLEVKIVRGSLTVIENHFPRKSWRSCMIVGGRRNNSSYCVIVWVRVVLKRTVVGD